MCCVRACASACVCQRDTQAHVASILSTLAAHSAHSPAVRTCLAPRPHRRPCQPILAQAGRATALRARSARDRRGAQRLRAAARHMPHGAGTPRASRRASAARRAEPALRRRIATRRLRCRHLGHSHPLGHRHCHHCLRLGCPWRRRLARHRWQHARTARAPRRLRALGGAVRGRASLPLHCARRLRRRQPRWLLPSACRPRTSSGGRCGTHKSACERARARRSARARVAAQRTLQRGCTRHGRVPDPVCRRRHSYGQCRR